jgi:hypothetical protein
MNLISGVSISPDSTFKVDFVVLLFIYLFRESLALTGSREHVTLLYNAIR